MNPSDKEINALTHRIIGCAMEVHNNIGSGFQEVIYQRALSIELNLHQIEHIREMEIQIEYKGFELGTRRVDFFIEGKIMLEIKALETLEGSHKAQAINYCEAYKIPDGLLINFGANALQFHRIYNKRLKNNPSPPYSPPS